MVSKPNNTRNPLRAGDRVRVRSRQEILATLDERGCLDDMPFMPEMLDYCGRSLRVFKRAHKTCDTVSGCYVGRRLQHMVHLEGARCSGDAHGGCEAACLVHWHERWLEPEDGPMTDPQAPEPRVQSGQLQGCSLDQLVSCTRSGHDAEKGPRYQCQATQMLSASKPLWSFDPRPYVEDLRSGNVQPGTMVRSAVYRLGTFAIRPWQRLGRKLGVGDALAKPLIACYDALQSLLPGGLAYPRRFGSIRKGQPTPSDDGTWLRPGIRVRVKPYDEIMATLDVENRTRGLYFDAEMVPYCGKELPVRSLVSRIIDERTGYMVRFKTPAAILESATCGGALSDNRMFCPRSIYAYWRPIWLTPVADASDAGLPRGAGASAPVQGGATGAELPLGAMRES